MRKTATLSAALALLAAASFSSTVTHGNLPYGLRIDTNLFNVAVGDIVTTPGGTLTNYATRADLAAAANAATNHSAANLNIAVGHADGLTNGLLRAAVEEAANVSTNWAASAIAAATNAIPRGGGGYTKAETDAKLGEKANLNGDPSENFAASLIEAGVLALGGSTITEESGGGLNLAFNVIVNDTVTDFYGNRLADKADREELERISPYILVVTNSIDAGAWGRIVFLPDGSVEIRRVAD